MRLVSRPSRCCRTSGALTPAAHTTNSEATKEPSASTRPCAVTSFTLALVRTSMPIWSSRRCVLSEMRSGRLVRMRSAASINTTRLSRTGADDRHVKLARARRAWLRLRAQAGVDQSPVESFRLRQVFQLHGVFCDAACSEIVGHAADGDHQRVVPDGTRRRDLSSLVVKSGGEMHFLACTIEPDHLAEVIAEAVPMRLSEVAQLAFARIDTARRHRVQAWLPQMRPRTLDQRHRRPQAPSQTIAKAGDEFQARCPAPDDDDAVQGRLASAQRRRLGA